MLHFRSFGEGYPLIILHGLFGSLDNWYTIGKKLSDRYHVYLVDQRNHGRSPHYDSHTYDDLANDLYIFMHEQHIDCAHIMGHSMGGTAAIQFSAQRSDMVNTLIVVDMAPRDYQPRHDGIFQAFKAVDPSAFSRRKDIDEALQSYLPDNAVRQYILKNIIRDTENSFHWKFNLEAIRTNYRAIISGPQIEKAIPKPTLFVKGERSSYITDQDIKKMEKMFPNMQLETIPGATHWVHADAPDLLIGAVRKFLDENG